MEPTNTTNFELEDRIEAEKTLIAHIVDTKSPYKTLIFSEIEPEMFSHTGLKHAFKIAQTLKENGDPVNLDKVCRSLDPKLKNIVNTYDLVAIHNEWSQRAEYFRYDEEIINECINKLKNKHAQKLLEDSYKKDLSIIKSNCFGTKNILEALAFSEQEREDILKKYLSKKSCRDGSNWAPAFLEKIKNNKEKYIENPNWQYEGVPTFHLNELDKAIPLCLAPGKLTILAGRPGDGKTAFSLQLATTASQDNHTVGFASLEMDIEDVLLRLVSYRTQIPQSRIERGDFSDKEEELLTQTCEKLNTNIRVLAASPGNPIDKSLQGLRNFADALKKDNGKLLIIDYIQIVDSSTHETQTERLAEVAYALKHIAIEKELSIFCLSQLNRDSEKRQEGGPRNSDLFGSSFIEAAADAVLCLYPEEQDHTIKKIKITKARKAEAGKEISLYFDGARNTFSSTSTPQYF